MKLRIEKLVYGGDSLAHWNGRAVFVPFVLPGEVVTGRIDRQNRKVIHAQPLTLLEASPERIDARCPYFARCGGCHYQHMEYERQVAAKIEISRETLRHIGKLEPSSPIVPHLSPPWEYRNRAQFRVSRSRRAGHLEVGYYRAGSHALCAVEGCPILSPKLQDVLETLNGLAKSGRLPDTIREIEAFVDDRDESLLLSFAGAGLSISAEALRESVARELPGLVSLERRDTQSEEREVAGEGFLTYRVSNHSYRVSHDSFFQVNRYLIAEMVAVATAGLGGDHALDLYAGVGLFSLALAPRFSRVTSVEAAPAALADLRVNAGTDPRLHIVGARVEEFLTEFREPVDAVLLDPPRAGAGLKVVEELVRLRPRLILYVSCDPATLARDLRALGTAGYSPEEIHFLDLFPQTYHLETIVRLRSS